MSRRTVRLTLDNLADLPGRRAGHCLFWELDPVRRDRVVRRGRAYAEKEAWVSHVLREWGSCGRVALVDDEPVGYVIYAPPRLRARVASTFPTAPISRGRRPADHGVRRRRPRRAAGSGGC